MSGLMSSENELAGAVVSFEMVDYGVHSASRVDTGNRGSGSVLSPV